MLRVLRTVRHLHPSQVLWRLRYVVERRLDLARRRSRRWAWTSDERPSLRDDFPNLRLPSPTTPSIRDLASGIFEHLNERKEIGYDRPDWRLGPCPTDRLWTVTLHYHEWAAALAVLAAAGEEDATGLLRHYVGDWIRRCGLERPGSMSLAWSSYAVATRIGWWIRARRTAPDVVEETFLRSLWQQAAYLYDHLEWDLRGNHLLRDAVGLAWAGRFFAGPRPRAWLRRATDVAVDQAAEQVLPDGVHFERSPKYHVDVMEDILVLVQLLEDADARAVLGETWTRMAAVLAWMRHPDGDLALFNDGSLAGPAVLDDLLARGRDLGLDAEPTPRRGGRLFADAGMAVWHSDPWTVFFDVGPVGPDIQPGHAHADTLTVECSFRGHRFFVDPGTFAYDDDTRRRYDRSTDAHNTVCIDGIDSSELWQIFRVGRRARPQDVSVDFRSDGFRATASHDGYRHLPGRPQHRRHVEIDDGVMTVVDRVTGRGRHTLSGGFLVAPDWTVTEDGAGWRLAGHSHEVSVSVDGDRIERFVERRPYHPSYGEEVEATRIGWRWTGDVLFEVRIVVGADSD